jgi:hypothetical protein
VGLDLQNLGWLVAVDTKDFALLGVDELCGLHDYVQRFCNISVFPAILRQRRLPHSTFQAFW